MASPSPSSSSGSSRRPLEDYSRDELVALVKDLRRRKRFGLVWEDKPEDVVEQCARELPVLEEVSERAIEGPAAQPTNLIIEGDNYHALSVLNYTHAGKVDVIYIDPPYNTGARDWKYNNNYVDSTDTFRHSKWLAMMNNRLAITKALLAKDGVLVVAIDDNEMHRLKQLIEELFRNYDIYTVVVVQNPRGNITRNFARTHEYAFFVIPRGVAAISRETVSNVTPRKLRRWGANSERNARPTMFYPIYVKDDKVTRVGAPPDVGFHPGARNVNCGDEIEVWPVDQDGVERRWNFGRDAISDELERIKPVTKNGVVDLFITEEITVPKTVWADPEFEAGRNGATLVKTITKSDFPYPKSIYTLKKTLELLIRGKKDATVLDYFAGSGTTGHAVLQLNREDGGSRRFILCTNNENGIAEEVTYPRIKLVIEGVPELPELTGIRNHPA